MNKRFELFYKTLLKSKIRVGWMQLKLAWELLAVLDPIGSLLFLDVVTLISKQNSTEAF